MKQPLQSKPYKRVKKLVKKFKRAQWQRASIFIGLFALVGITLLLATHAATPTASLEAELGTKTGVTTIADATASGSSYAQFGTGSSGCPSGQAQANDGSCVTLPPGTTQMVFGDEFSGAAVDTSLWTVMNEHSDASNSEQACYLPANTTVSGGFLNELLKVQTVTNCPNGGGTNGSATANYTSGAVQMKSFHFTYGTVEARIKFSGGQGSWPAFWMLGLNCQIPQWLPDPSTCQWPSTGSDEIDIAEIIGANSTFVNQAIHSNGNNPGCQSNAATDVHQNWHTYTFTWGPGSAVWKIDGVTTCTVTQSVPTTAMFVILNTSVGGSLGGTINNATLPQTSQFDYVRVFQ